MATSYTFIFLWVILWYRVSKGCELFGMAYTPYRVLGECPTAEEAEEDIRILMQHTKRVRTYTTLCVSVNRVLMRYADEGSLSVIFGVWIDNVEMDSMELQHLYDVLKEYPHANIEGIAIGNEVAFRGSMSTEQVANVVKNTRKEIRSLGEELSSDMLKNVPIFTIDIIPKKELIEASDLVAVNLHPFYRNDLEHVDDPEKMADIIVEASAEQIDLYRNLSPKKRFIICEIGWPTESAEYIDPNVGNLMVSYHFMKKFTAFARRNNIEYYFFELFDSEWKKAWYFYPNEALSEFHWGLYYGDRATPKFPDCNL